MINRNTRNFALTDTGFQYLQEARELLDHLQRLEERFDGNEMSMSDQKSIFASANVEIPMDAIRTARSYPR